MSERILKKILSATLMLVLTAQPGSVYSPSLFSRGNTTEQAAQSRDLEAAPQIVGTSSQPQILGVISSERSGYGAGLDMGLQGGNGCGIAALMAVVAVSQGSADSARSIESVAPTPATIGRDQNKNGERQNTRQTPETLETTSSQAEYERHNTRLRNGFLALGAAIPTGAAAFIASMFTLPVENEAVRVAFSGAIALGAGGPVAFCFFRDCVASRAAKLLGRVFHGATIQPASNQL